MCGGWHLIALRGHQAVNCFSSIRSLDIKVVAEGPPHASVSFSTQHLSSSTASVGCSAAVKQEGMVRKPSALAAWCACGAATMVALGMFSGRPAMQVLAMVAGGTVALCVGRHPSLLVAASLATALAAVAVSCSFHH